MFRLFVALLFLTALRPGIAAPAPGEEAIAQLYARGLAGDSEAVQACIVGLETRLAAQPGDQLARVYLGSAYTLRSRDLPVFGLAKLRALRHGMALMDEAAQAAPNEARVALLRAVTYEAFPAILGRREVAREALERLVAAVEKEPGKLPPRDRQLLYLNAGEAAQRAGDAARARVLWRRGALLSSDPKLAREIAAALRQL